MFSSLKIVRKSFATRDVKLAEPDVDDIHRKEISGFSFRFSTTEGSSPARGCPSKQTAAYILVPPDPHYCSLHKKVNI